MQGMVASPFFSSLYNDSVGPGGGEILASLGICKQDGNMKQALFDSLLFLLLKQLIAIEQI